MFEDLTTMLLAAFVGLGLVFGVALFFGALSAILGKIARGGDQASKVEGAAGGGDADERELRRRAALAAVSVALAQQAEELCGPLSPPPPVLVSTWQAVQRARLMGGGRWERRR